MSTPIMKIFLIISIAAIGLNADLLDSDKSKGTVILIIRSFFRQNKYY